MSIEKKLLTSLAKQFKADDLILAVETRAPSGERRAQFKALFEMYLDVQWNQHMKPLVDFVSHYYSYSNFDASEAKQELAADLIAAVCDVVRENGVGAGALLEPEWIGALKLVAARDAVATLKSLDDAGLIDRADRDPKGPLRELWVSSIVDSSEKCAQYLLSTTRFADLGGFPVPERDVWPETMKLARDIVANVPAKEFESFLEILFKESSYSTMDQLHSGALRAVCAALERASEFDEVRDSAMFQRMLEVTVAHTATNKRPEIKENAMAAALLEVMERCDRIATPEAFCYVRYLLDNDDAGSLISPARLRSLIERGLPMQAEVWDGADRAQKHLLTKARLCHMDVIDDFVTDKVAYMRQFGADFARAHSKRSPNDNSTDIEKAFQGVDNVELQKLVALGYPIGAIELDEKHYKGMYPLYKRVYGDGGKLDAFIIGHLTGQLDAGDDFKGMGPVHLAVGMGHVRTVRALVQAGFDVDAPCGRPTEYINGCGGLAGFTPILMAIKNCDLAMVRALVDLGADVTVKAPTGATAMQLAKNDALKQLIRAARTGSALSKAVAGEVADAEVAGAKPAKARDSFVL